MQYSIKLESTMGKVEFSTKFPSFAWKLTWNCNDQEELEIYKQLIAFLVGFLKLSSGYQMQT